MSTLGTGLTRLHQTLASLRPQGTQLSATWTARRGTAIVQYKPWHSSHGRLAIDQYSVSHVELGPKFHMNFTACNDGSPWSGKLVSAGVSCYGNGATILLSAQSQHYGEYRNTGTLAALQQDIAHLAATYGIHKALQYRFVSDAMTTLSDGGQWNRHSTHTLGTHVPFAAWQFESLQSRGLLHAAQLDPRNQITRVRHGIEVTNSDDIVFGSIYRSMRGSALSASAHFGFFHDTEFMDPPDFGAGSPMYTLVNGMFTALGIEDGLLT